MLYIALGFLCLWGLVILLFLYNISGNLSVVTQMLETKLERDDWEKEQRDE